MNYPETSGLYQGKFTDGDPVAGIPASVASAKHMNALYDELKALITAGGLAPDFNDLAQVSQSVGRQLRSKRLFDVSGTADAILLTTPAGKQPVTLLNDYDEFSFIVAATNTASSMTIKIDELAAMPLAGVVSDTQIFETALLTVRYINGAFYIVSQTNPKTGNSVLDIAKLLTDTTDILRPGEYALDGSSLSRTDHPIAFAIASASSNYVDQATKDADPVAYGGYYGDGDGVSTFTLPIVGGEFIRMFDDGRGVDDGREFGSWKPDEFKEHEHISPWTNDSVFSVTSERGTVGSDTGFFQDVNNTADVGTTTSEEKVLATKSAGGEETRPRSIAYYGKTRL